VVREHQTVFPARRIERHQQGTLWGDWDADRFAQVVSNLLGNALQYGDPDMPIEVRMDGQDDARVMLAIANGGVIPEDVLPKLFDPFRGGARTTTRTEGLGLGLYIVQQLVLAHGGTIEVESCDGRTVFRVVVPRRD
jgi:signal transduction histidine kinase